MVKGVGDRCQDFWIHESVSSNVALFIASSYFRCFLTSSRLYPFHVRVIFTDQAFFHLRSTVMVEALEKWSVPLLTHLLPRHMQIIFDINAIFLDSVRQKYPKDFGKLARMSLIEEGYPQHVRMANLAVIGSHTVNGVAALHSDLVQKDLFPDFVEFFGASRFRNVTNGITASKFPLISTCSAMLTSLSSSSLVVGYFKQTLLSLDSLPILSSLKTG